MKNRLVSVVILILLYIEHGCSFSYNPYCWVAECCNKDDIPGDTDKLRNSLTKRVYGQHFVENAVDAILVHWNPHHKPSKALTLSFHGWPGGGKNYVAKFIAESLFKHGMYSKFVHNFIGRVHFPENSHAASYRENLYSWLKYNVSKCGQQLFIFDEVDKMPPTVLNAIKPMIDYRNNVDGVDYTRAIFIFLSNTGASLINEHYQDLWKKGKSRKELNLKDFESLITKGAFNEEGGFQFSDTIKSNLIDHYIPFLPMEERHVRECIKDQFRERNVEFPSEEHINEVMEFIEWGPDGTKLFSKTGCKRISSKVAILVAKHYKWALKNDEL
nr:torsin-1A-like [Leptinotarsa decemlineata]